MYPPTRSPPTARDARTEKDRDPRAGGGSDTRGPERPRTAGRPRSDPRERDGPALWDAHWHHTVMRDQGGVPLRERAARAFVDVAVFGVVALRDLTRVYFLGTDLSARRCINAWIREGWALETSAGPDRGPRIPVVTLTRRGLGVARQVALERNMGPEQTVHCARLRSDDAVHDAAVYRACRKELRRVLGRGGTIRRLRLDRELQAIVARRGKAALQLDGRGADIDSRHRAARDLGLPVDVHGSVLFPDAQIEYRDSGGREGRINVEVVSDGYRRDTIRAKAAAGFSLHAGGAASARRLEQLGLGGEGGRDRPAGLIEI